MKKPVQLECPNCKNRNYAILRDVGGNAERLQLKKYCKFCRAHTVHNQRKK
ncbi:MAG: 50S ribosomal protein L33 [Planctomycetota bacterium]